MRNSDCDHVNGFRCVSVGNPNSGFTSFDNIMNSSITIFMITTLKGWTDIMYMIRKSTGNIYYDFYFIILIFIGNFFALNLIIAV